MRKLLWLAAILLPLQAMATDKPAVIDPYIHAEAPYGEGSLRKLFIKAYDAALWTDAAQWSMRDRFAFVITYAMGFEREELVDRSLEEMRHIGELPQDKADRYKQELNRVFPPEVHKGDTITALYDPKKGVTFFHNNNISGTIRDAELGRRFLSIWLSSATSEPGLREKLLSGRS